MTSDNAAQHPHAEHGAPSHGHSHGHGHGHDHGGFDWAERGAELVTGAEVVAPAVDAALDWLAGRVPNASAVTDVGSGPGVAAYLHGIAGRLAARDAPIGATDIIAAIPAAIRTVTRP